MTKKREDLDMTTIVDQAFSSRPEADALPGMMDASFPPPDSLESRAP
jgi:hypothetical protein